MRHNPFKIVDMFEEHMADYTGAPYAIAVDSCTNALFLCCKYLNVNEVTIPAKTYLSVPQSVIHAGGKIKFREQDWNGIYQLEPYPIWDAAKRLTSGMYIPGSFMCLSFHIKKHIKIGKGGMILTDNADAAKWFKQARYEGRNEVPYKQDDITVMGWNMYMTPVEAAMGLALMQNYPEHMEDQPEPGGYRDLREFSLFKNIETVVG
jgi:dTDP-4-amino-4,6-dideoxygalactose transaminase